jgi:hypothetical protein
MRDYTLEVLDEDEWMSMAEIAKAVRKKHPRMFQYCHAKSYDTMAYDAIMKLHLHGKIEVADEPIRARLMPPDTGAQIEFVEDNNNTFVVSLTPRQVKEVQEWLDNGGNFHRVFLDGFEE